MEGLACIDLGARIPIGASGNFSFSLLQMLHGLLGKKILGLHLKNKFRDPLKKPILGRQKGKGLLVLVLYRNFAWAPN